MKEMKTVNAVGQVLCHDITQIIKDVSKGPVFRKGHIIREEDIPVLLSVGKDHIYVWENDESMMHENDAAEVLCEIFKGENINRSEAKEGKIELKAACDGVLKIDEEKLQMVNSFGQMMIATRHGNFVVKKGEKLAGTRIIPLVIEKEKASIGNLQRVFRIGFNQAARIMDQLADAGVVGPEEGTKPRKILMTMEEFDEYMNI